MTTNSTERLDTPDPEIEGTWDWVDAPDDAVAIDTTDLRVTAVLVALDAATWLPETLAALSALEHRPDHLVAVDNGSRDDTGELLRQAHDDGLVDQIVTLDGDPVGFGSAVARAVAELPDTDDPRTEWLWLLHDDVLPRRDALDRLLDRVAGDPSVDVTGPKLIRPREDPVLLSEVGTSIAASGRRHLGLDPGEVDQGQHDEPRPVLAVSTCALLVRRTTWDELGGLTPALPTFRDGVDFGWRANRAGHRVVIKKQRDYTPMSQRKIRLP